MSDVSAQMLKALHEIRDLLTVMAEPQIAARDKRLRAELKRLVGKSAVKSKAVFLLNGAHTQAEIHKKTGFHKGNLSDFVKALAKAGLLVTEGKQPKLAISVPPNFFEGTDNDE
jgi:DNA-binding MarR family transcriptional regulator